LTVRTQGLAFHWPGFSLRVPDMVVNKGESHAITGASGCGKTTLLRLLSGELVGEGTVDVLGTALNTLNEGDRRRFRLTRLGLVFQDYPLMAALDARHNVALPLRLAGQDGLERADALLDRLGVRNGPVEALSQGQRQRVAVARAVVTNPGLVLADEPTSGLDPAASSAVLDLLLGLDVTLVVVTHDPAVRERLGHELALGSAG
jgi:putative ABC transport system ATP-binding protein